MSQSNWLRYLDLRGVLALFGTVLCWGGVPVMLRELTDAVDPWTANAIRFPLAAILYWPVLVASHRRGVLTRRVVRQCLFPAACIMGGQVFWAATPYYLPAASIGFFARLTMVFAIVFAMVLIRHERRLLSVSGFYWGLAISTVGFFLLAAAQDYSASDVRPVGILIISLCSLFMGLYTVSIRLCLATIHPVLSFGIVAQFVSLGVLIASAFLAEWSDVRSLTTTSWALLIASSLLGIGMAHTLMYVAIGRLGPSITASVQNLTPFATALLAGVFLAEELTAAQWIGGVAIVIGAAWLLKSHAVAERNASTN